MLTTRSILFRAIESLWLRHHTRYGALRPPVDPFALADLIGISVIRQHMVTEGTTVKVGDRYVIYLQNNFDDQPGALLRQRFTLAHEICHCLIGDDAVPGGRRMGGRLDEPGEEALCQEGAARILIPDTLLEREVTKNATISSLSDVKALASAFQVSIEAMVGRLFVRSELIDANFALALCDIRETGIYLNRGFAGAALSSVLPRFESSKPLHKVLGKSTCEVLLANSEALRESGGQRLRISLKQFGRSADRATLTIAVA